MKTMFRAGIFAAVLLAFCANSAELAWQKSLQKDNEWSRLTYAGTLLVASEGGLEHYDPASGDVMWSRDDLGRLAQFNVRDVTGTPYLVVSAQTHKSPPKTRVQVLNIASGATLWDSGELAGTALGSYPLPGTNLLLTAADLDKDDYTKAGLYVTARSLEGGEQVWKTRLGRQGSLPVYKSDTGGFTEVQDFNGHPPPVVTADTFILVAGDLIALDLASGAEKWRYKLKASNPKLKGTYAQPLLADGMLYAVSRNSLYALDLATGSEKWKVKIQNAPMPQLEKVSDLIVGRLGGTFSDSNDLVQAKPFGAFAVDTFTHELAWKWTRAKDSITRLRVLPDESLVLLADKSKLYALNVNAGKRGEIVYEQDLEFKRKLGAADVAAKGLGAVGGFLGGGIAGGIKGLAGGGDRADPPLDIERYGDQAIIRAQYHVLAYNLANRATDWSIEFAPPGMNPFALIAMGAVTATMIAGDVQSQGPGYNTFDSTMAIASGFQSAVAARYAAAQAERNVSFFLTREEEGLALVGINLRSGEEVGRIPMEEKEPQFMVDAIGSRVYYFRNKNELLAYDF
jgi:outer membrane protein assembly factor BamB